jgi:hypothetical protein
MDSIAEMLTRGAEQLLGRANGPLQFRLFVMPTVVTLLAIRAGLKDAREGQTAFLWAVISDRTRRQERILAAWKDVTRVFIVAIVLDAVYQLMVLRAFHVVQTLIVAVVCAILPYILFRGPTTRLARGLSGARRGARGVAAASPSDCEEIRQDGRERSGE